MADRPSMWRRAASALGIRRWESAETSRLNSAAWSKASDASINRDIESEAKTLRARSIYELSNNATVKGVIETQVIDIVGSAGPTLQIQSEDPVWNDAVEQVWNDWWAKAELTGRMSGPETLRVNIRTLWPCGEFLEQIVVDDAAKTPLKTRIQLIHPRRLDSSPFGPRPAGDERSIAGIRIARDGRPLGYTIVDGFDDVGYTAVGSAREIPPSDIIHWFRYDEPDQVRGVSWLAPVLQEVNDLRQFDVATLDAARMFADFAVGIYSDNPEIAPVTLDAGQTSSWKRRQINALPPGWKPIDLSPNQPTTQYKQFRHEKLRAIGRAVNMPLMTVLLDSGDHNYSSARFDAQVYWRGNQVIQAALTDAKLNRLLPVILAEARLVAAGGRTGIPIRLAGDQPLGWWPKWTWPVPPHVDPNREAQADESRLKQGTTTKADICARNGSDFETVESQRDREERAANTNLVARITDLHTEIEAANASHPNLKMHWSQILASEGAKTAPGAFLQGANPQTANSQTVSKDESTEDAAQDARPEGVST